MPFCKLIYWVYSVPNYHHHYLLIFPSVSLILSLFLSSISFSLFLILSFSHSFSQQVSLHPKNQKEREIRGPDWVHSVKLSLFLPHISFFLPHLSFFLPHLSFAFSLKFLSISFSLPSFHVCVGHKHTALQGEPQDEKRRRERVKVNVYL